ncbi:hypothetical protein M3Y97_00670000 [Aphelenchoides bicaudatus]|nr:hypothetical protein M3Y97_00670000 [Aphelenchoides bicaudatus]
MLALCKKEQCAVCHVKTGSIARHYGVLACLGCKTFYRRAVTQRRKYFCEGNQNCDVTERSGRQSCRFCRLKMCYAVGMQASALKGKRDSVGIRHNSFDSLGSRSQSPEQINTNLLQFIQRLTTDDQNLRRLKHNRYHSMTEMMKLSKAVNNIVYPPYFAREDLRLVDVIDMACATSGELHSLLEWTDTLSVFKKLSIESRTSLLRRFAVHQLVIESGYCTAQSNLEDIWLLPNNTCMPRDMKCLPAEMRQIVSKDRAWRQDKLYHQMTSTCLSDVAVPMKKLQLLPEEFVTLKIIMFCQFGNTLNLSENQLSIINDFKNQVMSALFEFYKFKHMSNYEERFGNILLLISGITGAANLWAESYQIMRVFGIVPFDKISNLLIFSIDNEEHADC